MSNVEPTQDETELTEAEAPVAEEEAEPAEEEAEWAEAEAGTVPGKIVELVPADPGWRAVFGGQEEWQETELFRVIAWALVEDDDGDRQVVGMIVDPVSSSSIVPAPNAVSPTSGEFLRYGYKPS